MSTRRFPDSVIDGFIKYNEYMRISFHKMLAYRVSYLIGVITYIIHVSVYYFLYKALYHQSHTINGYDLQQMVTYVAIGWISKSFYLNYIDRELTEEVKSGHVAMDLIKPIDFQLMCFARGLGQSLFRIVLFTPPIIIVTTCMFPISGPASPVHMFFFILSTFLSVLIYSGINYTIGLLSIFFLSISGILYSKNMIIELLSGLLIPLDWFPLWFQKFSAFLPFQAIAFLPLKIYLGRLDGSGLVYAISLQFLWVIITMLIGRLVWKICQRQILIQGG